MNNNEIVKINNFLPKKFHEEIKSLVFSNHFDWYFLADTTYEKFQDLNSFGFSHIVFNEDNDQKSNFFSFFWPMIYFIPSENNIKILRIRLGMQTKIDSKINHVNSPHQDYDFSHKTLLYYVNDSDGDTIFYSDEKCNNIIFKNAPEENSAVIFDGLIYHSSSHPTKVQSRVAININYLELKERENT